jgi:TonB-dependent starch-binding outer membrane protein SusC
MVSCPPGHSVSSFFGYQVAGLFSDAADIANSSLQDGSQPGFFKYADLNGDRVIDYKDRTFLGNPNPDFTVVCTGSQSFHDNKILRA